MKINVFHLIHLNVRIWYKECEKQRFQEVIDGSWPVVNSQKLGLPLPPQQSIRYGEGFSFLISDVNMPFLKQLLFIVG